MVTNSLEMQHRSDPYRIAEAVLVRWLEKDPRTWADLVTALREIQLGALAQEIEDNLCTSQVYTFCNIILSRYAHCLYCVNCVINYLSFNPLKECPMTHVIQLLYTSHKYVYFTQ